MGKDINGKELGKGIYQRKDGRYEARTTVNGRPICIYGKNLSRLKADFRRAKLEKGYPPEHRYQKMTLNEWFLEWYERYKVPFVRENSVQQIRSKFLNTFGKRIGRMRVTDIRHIDIQNAVTEMVQEGRASSSIRSALSTLTQCMQAAVQNNIITSNPCVEIRVPWQKREKERRFLTEEEQDIFLEFAKDSWYYEMFYIMLNTGLRIGEVGGLQWKDVDFRNKCIHVNQALTYRYDQGVKVIKFSKLKTVNSYRTIPFINDVEKMFRSQQEKQRKLKKQLGKRYRNKDEFENVVFVTTMGSSVMRTIAEREMNKVVRDINLFESVEAQKEQRIPEFFERVYPHAFRHTFCSRCFEKDINPKMVQKLMGHAHYSTTIDIYTHISKKTMEEEFVKFQRQMSV